MKFKNIKVTQRNRAIAARNAEKKLTQGKAPGTKEQPVIDYAALQERTRSVLFDCMEFVLLKEYNESTEAFAGITDTADMILKQYALISRDMSKATAEKWLADKLNGKHCVMFMLPVVKYPKKGRERAELDFVRQEAFVWAKAFCYALGQIRVATATNPICFKQIGNSYSAADIDEIFRLVAKQYRERASL